MHNGHLATLHDVVKHYSEIDLTLMHQVHLYDSDGVPQTLPVDKILRPLNLSEREIDDVVAFLNSLTEKQPRTAAPAAPKPSGCQ
jgi:cytochrome c peroxidase